MVQTNQKAFLAVIWSKIDSTMGIFNKQSKTMVIQTSEYSPYGSDSFSAPRTGDSGISGFSSFSNVAEYERRDQVKISSFHVLHTLFLRIGYMKRSLLERWFCDDSNWLIKIYKTNIRLLRFVTRCISLALSGYMVGSMSYTLLVYLQTRNHTSADSPSTLVWGSPKTLWPTYLILALSSLTAIMNIVTISAYLCSIAAANKSGDFTVFAGYVMLGIEIIVWSVASGLYKYSDRGDDLWGFSCGKSSESVIEKVESFVNWGKLCQTQVSARCPSSKFKMWGRTLLILR